jgi:agmatine deiminase
MTYTMPAEWMPHAYTCIAWPQKKTMVHPHTHPAVCRVVADIIRAIACCEPVIVIVDPEEHTQWATLWGMHSTRYRVHPIAIRHDDAWFRDNGPTFVLNEHGQLHGVQWTFNAWGEKYPDFANDATVATQLLDHLDIPRIDGRIVMEGGSFHVDGEGTMLTTAQCLLHPKRNPTLSQKDIVDVLSKMLGITHTIWLHEGLIDDETDGHIDNVACFAAPGRVLLQVCTDPTDPQYAISQRHVHDLRTAHDARGRAIETICIPQPPAVYDGNRRLTLSYINFSFVNGAIIVPTFGMHTDEDAVRILANTFPERTIHPIDGMALIREGGNVHCMTQQIPYTHPLATWL